MFKKFIVNKDYHNTRFDRWFKHNVQDVPQSLIEKLIRKKKVKINKKKVKTSYRVQSNDIIELYGIDNLKFKPKSKNNKYKPSEKEKDKYDKFIIENNDNFIVINKPSGIPVQGGTKSFRNIIDILKNTKYFENSKPFVVHRLDKETSGLLIVARDQQTAKKFSNYFKGRKIIKTYLAIVSPCPKTETGIIDLPLLKGERKGQRKMTVDHEKGKQAITEYKILDKVSSRVGLIALYPKTGRTHQLRVHLENINAPIVGDKKYNGSLGVYSSENDLPGHESISQIKWNDEDIKNLQLHAYSIRMPSNEVIEAELSENFKKNLKFLGLTLPKNINNIFI